MGTALMPTLNCLKCRRFAKTRGLCFLHYNRLQRRIKAGETTWQEAEQQCECLAAKPRKTFMADLRSKFT